ncbi:somatomedin-B and thrombospondin type-1 domain-containing protein [Solea senegalensis]|uniref:Somatomedin-B and thrombospondin type-1 domain-containing protein n=1 Tax=Solea senegalensis TaxID=28829 RepID=A0AAV6T5J0_SOLSE|nr:somatomedin-B and thrombospondin type-1 domain-containing protein isoform X2 [Solea senegalensis]XP_058505529.1 somatomedin-B and thrombospondin type-1 domain-containing protein [Solea solea]KAG7524709.1 somatomedin-B and thrombospondin type-1 domain-containing protein [Solea senegalensis]
MMGSSVEFACLLLMLSTLGKNLLVSGGCSGKCCRGRDLICFTKDWRMDRVFGTCYCDESCVRTKDCCFDYFTECPAQDCAVSDWSFWSGCAKHCQPSVRVRVRHVEQRPSNSGEPCPSLEQQAGCREYRDHQGNHCGLNSGPAFIASMEFGKGRRRHDSYGNPLDPGFCVEFTLKSRTPHCTVENRPHTHWMRYITEGFKVCVACEPPAMRNNSGNCQGDGQESDKGALLHWQAVGNPQCRGTWKKMQTTQQCDCPPQHSFVFI